MKFDDPDASNKTVITLGIYGITPVDPRMKAEIEQLLQFKLIELAALAISPFLTAKKPISLEQLRYLKENKFLPRIKRFTLPSYVTDTYLFMSLVKQIILSLQPVLSPVTYQASSSKSFSFVEHFNPCCLGYDLSITTPESANDSIHDANSFGHRLKRPARVESIYNDVETSHPAFHGRSRATVASVWEDPMLSSTRHAYWAFNEFTFSYNVITKDASALSRHIVKQVTQGLALIVLGVGNMNIPLQTGSRISLIEDVKALRIMLKNGGVPKLSESYEEDLESSSHIKNRTSVLCRNIWLKLYPAMPMADEKLMQFCESILDHALYIYCIERLSLFADLQFENSDDSALMVVNRRQHLPNIPNEEIVGLLHELQHNFPSSVLHFSGLTSTGCYTETFPLLLRLAVARELHRAVVEGTQNMYPWLRRAQLRLASVDRVVGGVTRDLLKWHSPDGQVPCTSISTFFGDLLPLHKRERELPVLSTSNTEPRLIVDFDGQTILPEWLRKRKISLEIVVSPVGIYIFYFNMAPHLVRGVIELCAQSLEPLRVKAREEEEAGLRRLGVCLNPIPSVPIEDCTENQLYRARLGRLSWSQKKADRLYLKLASAQLQQPALELLDPGLWRRGLMRFMRHCPCTPVIHELFLPKLVEICRKHDIDLVTYTDAIFILTPLPNSDIVHSTEIQFREQIQESCIVFTERTLDLHDLAVSMATSTQQRLIADRHLDADIMSHRKYRYSDQVKASFMKASQNSRLVTEVRTEMWRNLVICTIKTLTSQVALDYDTIMKSITTLRLLGEELPVVLVLTDMLLDESIGRGERLVEVLGSQELAIRMLISNCTDDNGNAAALAMIDLQVNEKDVTGLSFITTAGETLTCTNIYFNSTAEEKIDFMADVQSFISLSVGDMRPAVSADKDLKNIWQNHIIKACKAYRLHRAWEAVIFQHYCGTDELKSITELSCVHKLSCLDRFSETLYHLLCDVGSTTTTAFCEYIRKYAVCYVGEEFSRPYLIAAKQIFGIDTYDIGLLITLQKDDNITVLLLESELAPNELDLSIEQFIISFALCLVRVEKSLEENTK
jgi:hypothetical protein